MRLLPSVVVREQYLMFLLGFQSAARSAPRALPLGVATLALAGCGGLSGIQPVSQIRVINVSPDSPALDIRPDLAQSSTASAQTGVYNISFGTVSSYMAVAPGAYTHVAYTAGTQQQLATVRGKLLNGGQYTVLTSNIAASLQMTLLRDRSTPAPPGQVALRFLDQATRSGAVDIYLQPAGASIAGLTPVATSMTFGHNTGYVNAPAGTYSVVVVPAGTAISAEPAFTASQVSYPAGSVRTILLVDQTGEQSATRSLQIVTANDYDPAAAS